MEVRPLEVRYGLKALLPHGVPLIVNWKEHDWHRDDVSKASSTQGSEGDLCRLLDGASRSTPMTNIIQGSVRLRGMVTLTSHCSML
jgi:hypothetical protein